MIRAEMTDASTPLYTELASWWPLLSAAEDYTEEAAFYEHALVGACERPPRTILELGSRGGNNASDMKKCLEMVLVDRSPARLAVSRRLNPGANTSSGTCARQARATVDCLFVHDAVCHMTTAADLHKVIETRSSTAR